MAFADTLKSTRGIASAGFHNEVAPAQKRAAFRGLFGGQSGAMARIKSRTPAAHQAEDLLPAPRNPTPLKAANGNKGAKQREDALQTLGPEEDSGPAPDPGPSPRSAQDGGTERKHEARKDDNSISEIPRLRTDQEHGAPLIAALKKHKRHVAADGAQPEGAPAHAEHLQQSASRHGQELDSDVAGEALRPDAHDAQGANGTKHKRRSRPKPVPFAKMESSAEPHALPVKQKSPMSAPNTLPAFKDGRTKRHCKSQPQLSAPGTDDATTPVAATETEREATNGTASSQREGGTSRSGEKTKKLVKKRRKHKARPAAQEHLPAEAQSESSPLKDPYLMSPIIQRFKKAQSAATAAKADSESLVVKAKHRRSKHSLAIATDTPLAPSLPTKKSKKKARADKTDSVEGPSVPPLFSHVRKSPQAFQDKICSIVVHRSNALVPDVHVLHPLVRVHLVDMKTGHYISKSEASRSAVFSGEGSKTTHVLPILTKAFSFAEHETLAPKWEEELLVNEDYLYLLQENVMVLFEILDFATYRTMKSQANDGWYRVAWAFLKLVGSHKQANTECEARLQLYTYPSEMGDGLCFQSPSTSLRAVSSSIMRKATQMVSSAMSTADKSLAGLQQLTGAVALGPPPLAALEPSTTAASGDAQIPHVYKCWKFLSESGRLGQQKYPGAGCLFVTVASRAQLNTRQIFDRPILPTDIEKGRQTFDQLMAAHSFKAGRIGKGGPGHTLPDAADAVNQTPYKAKALWRRRAGEKCRLPNRLLFRLHPGLLGSIAHSFSPQGDILASSTASASAYSVKIYSMFSGDKVLTLEGHQDLVNDMVWSESGQELATVSSDGNVILWLFLESEPPLPVDGKPAEEESSLEVHLKRVMPHPCFVYSAKWMPNEDDLQRILVTGAYDGIIRFWSYELDLSPDHRAPSKRFSTPIATLAGHDSHVNSLAFDEDGSHLFSGDGNGVMRVWSRVASKHGHASHHYECIRVIRALEGNPITHFQMHPNFRQILIHAQDNVLRSFDVRLNRVFTECKGLVPGSKHLKSSWSPCGSYVLSGTETGQILVWNAESGDLVAKYLDLPTKSPIAHVSFHPWDHMLAMSAYGEDQPLLVFTFDPDMAPIEEKSSGVQAAGGDLSDSEVDDEIQAYLDRISQLPFLEPESAEPSPPGTPRTKLIKARDHGATKTFRHHLPRIDGKDDAGKPKRRKSKREPVVSEADPAEEESFTTRKSKSKRHLRSQPAIDGGETFTAKKSKSKRKSLHSRAADHDEVPATVHKSKGKRDLTKTSNGDAANHEEEPKGAQEEKHSEEPSSHRKSKTKSKHKSKPDVIEPLKGARADPDIKHTHKSKRKSESAAKPDTPTEASSLQAKEPHADIKHPLKSKRKTNVPSKSVAEPATPVADPSDSALKAKGADADAVHFFKSKRKSKIPSEWGAELATPVAALLDSIPIAKGADADALHAIKSKRKSTVPPESMAELATPTTGTLTSGLEAEGADAAVQHAIKVKRKSKVPLEPAAAITEQAERKRRPKTS